MTLKSFREKCQSITKAIQSEISRRKKAEQEAAVRRMNRQSEQLDREIELQKKRNELSKLKSQQIGHAITEKESRVKSESATLQRSNGHNNDRSPANLWR